MTCQSPHHRIGASAAVLQNHDFTQAVGDATAVVIRAAADELWKLEDRGKLLRLADTVSE